jgi:hypothetical protein
MSAAQSRHVSRRRSLKRHVIVGGLAILLAACGGDSPIRTVSVSPAAQTPGSSTSPTSAMPSSSPSSVPSEPADLSSLRWYEVRRVHDLNGMETRTLLFGTLGGRDAGELPLGSISFDERQGGAEPFAWIDPQADGVFAGKALVWGRDGDLARLEAIDLLNGDARPLVEAQDVIHVATADVSLTKVFFITAEETGQPTGLWVDDVSDEDGPEPLRYDFGAEPIHNFSRFRLAANTDGSLLAVQQGDGKVTLVDVATGGGEEVSPGGPLLGFTDDYLVSLGAQSPDGTYPVVAFDVAALEGFTAFRGSVAAQVVGGGRASEVVVMTFDATANAYDIHSVSLHSGDNAPVYRGDAGTNPFLARRDRTFVGYEAPPGTVLLVESFTRFIGEPPPGRELPQSAYPLLLNLKTGETTTLGPWESGP